MSHDSDGLRTPSYGPNPGRFGSPRAEPHRLGLRPLSDSRRPLEAVGAPTLMTAEEEMEFGGRFVNASSPAHRDRLWRMNLRLVAAVAANYSGRGLADAELIEEGNAGLRRAAECFDPTRDPRFSTGARWWIKQAIRQALANARNAARIPGSSE
ncbi:MAG: sigma factor [Phycisphaerales bacterium]